MPLNPLGTCQVKNHHGQLACNGPLAVSGGTVRCERCGNVAQEHPLTRQQPPARPPGQDREVSPIDYVATVPDRVLAVEKQLQKMLERFRDIEARLAQQDAKAKQAKGG